jgi:SNF2 family DNA or RNA helicase
MELWSLMHFLMPNVFESHRDFKEWFSNPLTGMVEGSAEYNESLIQVTLLGNSRSFPDYSFGLIV